MPASTASSDDAKPFLTELAEAWRQVPFKPLFIGLTALWIGLFYFLGNPTLGYVAKPSIFGWLEWIYKNSADDAHGRLIPFVVAALFWWKRKLILAAPARPWWPAIALLIGAL